MNTFVFKITWMYLFYFCYILANTFVKYEEGQLVPYINWTSNIL